MGAECPSLEVIADETLVAARMAEDLRGAFEEGRDTLKPQLKPFDVAAFLRDQEYVGNLSKTGGLTYRTDIESGLSLVMADTRCSARTTGQVWGSAIAGWWWRPTADACGQQASSGKAPRSSSSCRWRRTAGLSVNPGEPDTNFRIPKKGLQLRDQHLPVLCPR